MELGSTTELDPTDGTGTENLSSARCSADATSVSLESIDRRRRRPNESSPP